MNTATATTSRTIWTLDPSHSELLFEVKHLMISNVKGAFRKVNASIDMVGSDLSTAAVQVNIDAASIFTNDESRDKHLRSADFFDAEHHPELTFSGTSFTRKGSDHELTGNLTIKGVTRQVTLNVEFGGVNKDPWGNEKMGFSISGTINRTHWGLNWNAALEAGGVLVSDEVRISAEVQFVKQA
ncbi:MAG: YceI family protein [Flavobacteriales bacterium]